MGLRLSLVGRTLASFFAAPVKRQPEPARPARLKARPIKWTVKVRRFKPFTVTAHTKSEARAVAKRVLGLRDRLPAYSTVEMAGRRKAA